MATNIDKDELKVLLQEPDVRNQLMSQVLADIAALPPDEKLEVAKLLFPAIPWALIEKFNVANVDWEKALEKLIGLLPKKQVQQATATGMSFMEEVRARMKKS